VLRINDEYRLEFDFGNEEREEREPEATEDLPRVGRCPKCGGDIVAGATAYYCVNTQQKTCDFRVGRTILQQEIKPEEVQKILAEGKSSLMTDFVSNRSHRKFKAFLVLDPKTHKIGFEFPPREEKAPVKRTARKSAAKK
jgi:DNA topoisomerase-3